MKVYIGPYPGRLTCNIHTRYMRKKYGYDWGEQTKFENFLEKLEDTIQDYIYNPINRVWFDKQEQKVKVRINPHDAWSADHTLAHIILPLLKEVAKCKHGAPVVDMTDVPSELRVNDPEDPAFWGASEDLDPKFFERWDYVLERMIWSFEQYNTDWEDQFHKEWGFDVIGRKTHEEKIQEGLRLFGKYYSSLWT